MSRPSAAAPALSIVIPAPADAAALEATLVSVLENRPPACEVVVPLGFAYDDRWGIADEVRLVTAPPDSGVAACANVGIAASAAPLVHVLAAGWLATPGWTEQPLDILADRRVQAVVPVGVTGDAAATIASTGVRLTRGGRRVAVVPSRRALRAGRLDAARVRAAAPVLEAGFWRAGAIAAIGPGFALACLPGRVVVAPESRVVCGAGRDRPRPFTAGLQAERLFWRSLARGGLATSLVGHVIEIVRDAVASAPLGTLPMLLGRTVALMQCGDFVARFARLRALRRTPAAASEGTLRIDAAHASPARPRLRTDDAPPLKRSA
jgi:hypothetical protein